MSIVIENQAKIHRWALWFMVNKLAKQIGLQKYTISGSYRRGNWWCNDIDLLVPVESKTEGEGIKAMLKKLGWKTTPGRAADDKEVFSTQYLKETPRGIIVLDLFLAPPGSWGNCLLFTTGPKNFNDDIRTELIENGYSWSNPRYFTHILSDRMISFNSESGALAFLNKSWITPHKRK